MSKSEKVLDSIENVLNAVSTCASSLESCYSYIKDDNRKSDEQLSMQNASNIQSLRTHIKKMLEDNLSLHRFAPIEYQEPEYFLILRECQILLDALNVCEQKNSEVLQRVGLPS